jgi:hypothetical protein
MAILNHGSTLRTADGGQSTTTIVTASNIGSYAVASNATYYIGTTQNVFNRASGAQTLTGVSIDGNAANITAYTINQNVGSSNSPTFATLQLTRLNFGADNAQPWTVGAGGTAGTGLTFGGDYTSSQAYKIFTAMENVGGNYSKLTLNWHTGIRIGAYYGYGGTRFYNNLVGEGTEIFSVGNADSNVRVVNNIYAQSFYDITNTAYYLDPANTGTSLLVAGSVGVSKTSIRSGSILDVNGYGCFGASAYGFYIGTDATGAFLDAGSQLIRMFAGSSEKLRIQADGNVGIGTTSPSDKLHVYGGSFKVTGGSDLNTGILLSSTSTNVPVVSFRVSDNSQRAKIEVNDANGAAGDRLGFFVYQTGTLNERLSVLGNGNVGIGTTSPGYKLDITGDARIASAAGAGALYFGTLDPSNVYLKVDNNYDLTLAQNASSGNGLYLAGAGNVYVSIDSNNNATADAFIVQNNAIKAGTELFRVQENGVVTASSDFRAPIFYDSNDTGYYVDPNSVSRLSSLRVYSAFDTASSDVYANMRVMRNNATNDGMYIGYGNLGSTGGITRIFGGGATTGELAKYIDYTLEPNSFRAPIFYDSNDTAYYVDPASNSRLLNLGLGNVTPDLRLSVSGDAQLSGILYLGGTAGSYGSWGSRTYTTSGILYNNSSSVEFNNYGYGSTWTFTLGGGNATSSGSFRAPIFYDSDNTTYYLDAANSGTSLLVAGKVGIGTTSPTSLLHLAGVGGDGVAFLRIAGTASDAFNWGSSVMYANLAATETAINLIGKAQSQYNCSYIGYRHVADGSALNMLSLGLYAADHLVNILGNGNVGIGTTSPANKLHVVGSAYSDTDFRAPIFYDSNDTGYFLNPNSTSNLNNLRAATISAANHGLTCVYYGGGATPTNGYLITTNIDYSTFNMPTVIIEGYAYGNGVPIHLEIVWYAYTNSWTNLSYTNLGAWNPGTVSIGTNASGKVCLHLSGLIYYGRFNVRCIYDQGNAPLEGWTVTDATTSALTRVTTISKVELATSITGNAATVTNGLYTSSTLTAGNLSGTIPSGVLGNSTHFIGTTSIALNRASASQTLTGVSIDGNAATATNGLTTGNYGGYSTFSGVVSSASGGFQTATYAAGRNRIWSFGNSDGYGLAYFQGSGGVGGYDVIGMHFGTATAAASQYQFNAIGSFTASGDVRAPIFYDSGNTAYYLDPASTSNLNNLTVANDLTVNGNTYLGNAGGDTVFVNDIIRIGATDSGDASLFFGEGSVAGSDYGARWYWDSGYTFTWYTRNAGTDTALFDYVTNDTTYLNWRRHFHMQNKEINYNAQIHFNAGTRFVGNNTQYLIFKSDSTSLGGIQIKDGSDALKGYIGYWDSGGGGILNNTGNWAVRYNFGSSSSGGTLYGTWNSDTDFRAPIFYDSNNTAYYIDGASGSKLKYLQIDGDWGSSPFGSGHESFTIRSTYASMVQRQTNGGLGYWLHHIASDAAYYLYGGKGATDGSSWDWSYKAYPNQDGSYVEFRTSARAPLFYDSNDTAYYVDPNGTSSLYNLSLVGAKNTYLIINPGNGSEAMVRYIGGSGSGWYVGKRMSSQLVGTADFHFFSEAAGATVGGVDTSGNIFSSGSVRSPIFYDSNNTAYYVDPSSTGYSAYFAGAIQATKIGIEDGGLDCYMEITDANPTVYGVGYGGEFIFYGDKSTPASFLYYGGATVTYTLQANSSLRSPIFYDSNDTGYYCDPASNSVLNGLYVNAYYNLSNDYKDIYVYGDVNTYYVVLIQGEYLYSFGRYSVTRGYNWTGPDTWNTASHKGGLTLDWEWSGDTAWGGNDKAIRIIEFNESYSTMVAGLGYPVNGGVIIWLRGGGVGGAQYRIRTPIGSNATVTAYDGVSATNHSTLTTFTAADSSVFTTRANANNVSAEILARYPVRSAASLYNDNNLVVDIGSGTQTKSGIFASAASVRAPIFYDTDNTAYYLDPAAGTSLRIAGAIVGDHAAWTGEQNKIQWHSSHLYFQNTSDGYFIFRKSNGAEPFTLRIAEEAGYATGSWRAPIFYDSNNTAYYTDPASTSNLLGLTVVNTITGSITGNAGGSSASCTGNAATATRTSGQSGYPHAGTGMWAFYNWGGNDGGTSAPSASTYTTGLSVGSNPGDQAYGFQIANNMWNTGLWTRNYNSSFGSWIRLLDSSNYVGYSAFTGNVDGTQFRDANDTTYYLDPAGTSNLNKFSTLTMSYNDMNSMHVNSPYVTRYNSGAAYRNGTMGWSTVDCNHMFSNWGSGFIDSWTNPANGPGSSSHYVGFQSLHYNHQNNVNGYGFQMLCAGEADNRFFWRSAWPTLRSWVEMIHTGNIASQTVTSCTGTAGSISGFNNPTTAATANTIVYRDSSGHIIGNYIFGGYFNSSAGNSENPTIGQIWTQSTGDNYLRKSTPAHFRSQVTDGSYPSLTGANASGTWSINITGNAGGSSASCTGNSATTTLATKATRANGNFYIDDNYGNTVVGVYSASRYQGVFAMGDSYKLAADGTTTGNLYGIAWSHQNAGGAAGNLASHGLLILENGVFKGAWGGGSLRTPGDVRGTLFYDWDNTGYYCDPASTSNLNAITAAGNITAAQYYTANWFRSTTSGNGLYNEATGQHFYSDSVNYWNVASSASAQGIRLRTGGHNGTVRGYFYADTNNDVGLLNQDGNWRIRVVGGDYTLADGSSMRAQMFYDSNDTTYYTDPASTSILNVVRANSYVQKSASQSLSGTVGCTIDVNAAGIHVLTLAASTTISSFTYNNRTANPSVNTIMLVIKYGGTASITWTNVLWANGITPTITGVSGYADVYMLTSYQGTTGVWIGTVVAQGLVSTSL